MLRLGGPIARATLLLLAAALATAATAQAGTYPVYGCHLPSGPPTITDGWTVAVNGGANGWVNGYDGCAGNAGLMTLEHYPPGGPSATFTWSAGSGVTWTFRAPADTTIAAVSLDRQFSGNGAQGVYWHLRDSRGDREACTQWGGSCVNSRPASYRVANWNDGVVQMAQVCEGSGGCSGPITTAYVSRTVIELDDDLAPLPSAPPSGSLVDTSRALSGRAEATVALRDQGGGVSRVDAEIDGRVVETRYADPGNCRGVYVRAVPCPLTASTTVGVDTDKLADGAHQLRLIGTDVAGNTAVQGPYAIRTRNMPTRCGPSVWGAVVARLPGGATTVQRRARATRVRGTAPAGAELRLLGRIDRRGERTRVLAGPIVVGADHRYSMRIPKGPSRRMRVAWKRPGDVKEFACSRRLHVRVRAAISLAEPRPVAASRPRARFRGRLKGGFVPRRGTLVVLQGRQPGRGWRTFSAIRTDRKGRFKTSYRFSGARGSFQVRARVPASAAYPFAPGTSRSVTLRVR